MTPDENAQLQESQTTHTAPEDYEPAAAGVPRWVGVALGILAVLVVAALWLSLRNLGYSRSGLRLVEDRTKALESDSARSFNGVADRLTQVQAQNADLRRQLAVLSDKLEAAEDDAQTARSQVRRVRNQEREQMKHLAAMSSVVNEQLAAKANAEDLKSVSSDVASVRDEIKTTNNELQMSRSDAGTLIARNHDEIEILRQMGERDYFEFAIRGKNASEKMGDVTITLRATDPKKNECNLELFVDDKHTEKRNRAINEPIFFYRDQQKRPVEIVINKITKDSVAGYLSVPKEKQGPTIAGASF